MAAAAGAALMLAQPDRVLAGARRRHRDGAAREHDGGWSGDGAAVAWSRRSCAARRRTRAPVWAPLCVVVVLSSVVALLALRGRGVQPVLEARPIDASFDRSGPRLSGRVIVIAIDARVARPDHRRHRRGRLPNFGRIPRRRRRPPSGDSAADLCGGGCGLRSRPGTLPQKNGGRSSGIYQLAGGGAVQLLPTTASRTGSSGSGFWSNRATRSATLLTRRCGAS